MRIHYFNRICAVALAALLITMTGKAAAESGGLNLAKVPLFGLGVKPNILLVLDDSTTMDLEVLFSGTRDGVLYWKPSLLKLLNDDEDRPTWQDGHFVNGIGPQYAFGYLFPNGINNWINAEDRRASSGYKAIPPLPAMAFARSPAYNEMYFNPNVEYIPWPGMPDATPGMADPAPGVNRTLTEQPPIIYPLQSEEEDDNCGGLLGGLLCGIGDLLGSLDDVLSAVGGLVGNILNLGNDEAGQPPEADKVAINLTAERGHFDPGELFTYGSWLPDIPDNRQYIGCTTGSLLLGLVHEDSTLQSVLSGDTVETVFGVLFGVLTNVNGLLKGALQAWLGDGLIDAVTGLPQLLADLLELVGDSVDNILGVLLGVINLILGGSSNSDGTGFTDVNSLLGGVDGIVHEVIVLVVGLLDVLKIPTPCLNMAWTNSQTDGLLTGLVDNVVKEGVVGQITGFTSKIALQYYPATFYMPAGATLPDEYDSYRNSAKNKIGYAPDQVPGEDQPSLVRFQIKADNFNSSADYQKAIQNFANWFTYYRKRHLAVRGAVMQVLDDVSGIRVGVVTTNKAAQRLDNPGDADASGANASFKMYDIDTMRTDLYDAIETLDFSKAQGTPNRKGLQYAGKMLEQGGIIEKACQPNYAMLLTDGFNRAGVAASVGNVDGGYDSVFSDTYDNSIADVAMQYYQNLTLENPFPDSAPPVPTPAACSAANPPLRLDCQTEPHMVTYGITLGQPGEIFNNPDNWPVDPYATAVDWPDPNPSDVSIYGDDKTLYESVDDLLGTTYDLLDVLLGDHELDDDMLNGMGAEQIDDLWHATVNTRGEMFLAQTPREMTGQLKSMLRKILATNGSAGNLAAGDELIFQALFTSYDWSGDLIAYQQTDSGPGAIAWQASTAVPAPDSRVILTQVRDNCGNGNTSRSPAGFTYDNLKNGCQALSEEQVQYLRGDAANESVHGGDFRNRYGNMLGDIVHSTPAVVGKPKRYRYPQTWVDRLYPETAMPENSAPDYNNPAPDVTSDFAETAADRTPVVYVGANDGMLHGFNAETGAEVLAYIPGVLLRDDGDADDVVELAELTDPAYSHEPYVDGSPAVGDVVFGNAWHTVLVSGLRGGGQAVFALDVTTPSQFAEDNADETVLWEFTDPDLGYTYGKPSIVRLHNGQWAAVFGNGYNGGSGAQLFVVDIETGTLIEKIEAASANDAPNGLAQPAPVDVDGDFIVDYFYAGDLQGNLWKFDLTDADPNAWTVSKLIHAEDDANKPQPITTQPVVATHPYGQNYGVMVYFGTGKLLETGDTGPDNPQHSFYGIWDPNVIGNTISDSAKPATVSRDDDLVEQAIIETSNYNGDIYRVLTDKEVSYSGQAGMGDRGWYIDLTGSGEVMIATPYIRDGVVGFSTALPQAEACVPGGSGFIMQVAAMNGGRTAGPSFDASNDGSLSDSDKVFAVADNDDPDSEPQVVAASGVKSQSGRPSAATFVPGQNYVLYNTTSGTILTPPANTPDSGRRTWRIIRP